jgi:hypothetical protein
VDFNSSFNFKVQILHKNNYFLLKKDNGNFLAADFWTSATNLGPLTAARYKWCGSGVPLVDVSVWESTSPQPNLYWEERCAYGRVAAATPSGLFDYQCTNSYHLLCEN